MKRIIIYAAFFSCAVMGCSKKEKLSLAGVYKLQKQTISGDGKDSTYERTQMKIYTDHYFMYAGMTPDSSIGFGVGPYDLDTGNRVIEHRVYSSSTLDSPRTFKLKITPKDSGYFQTIPAMAAIKGVKYDLNEQYIKLPAGDSSALDGLWKMDKGYNVKGKDTIKQSATEYKIFWKGYFMYMQHYMDSKLPADAKNAFGYGSFSFSNNKVSGEVQMSNDAAKVNQKFSIDLKLSGNEFTQVMSDPKTNTRIVEIWKKVK
jgi:hypothetical protein